MMLGEPGSMCQCPRQIVLDCMFPVQFEPKCILQRLGDVHHQRPRGGSFSSYAPQSPFSLPCRLQSTGLSFSLQSPETWSMVAVTPLPTSRLYLLVRQLRPKNNYYRALTTTSAHHQASQSLPSTPTCPPSECTCAPMPEGLEIDHKKQLNGTMPPYAQHVVIRTGRTDWSSKIEEEGHTLGKEIGGGNLAASLKGLVGKGGKYHDVSRQWYPQRIPNR